jgi:hypothetical protein
MTKEEIAFSHLNPLAAAQVVHAGSTRTQDNETQSIVRLLHNSRRNAALGPSTTGSRLEYIASVLQEAISIADICCENEENKGQRKE